MPSISNQPHVSAPNQPHVSVLNTTTSSDGTINIDIKLTSPKLRNLNPDPRRSSAYKNNDDAKSNVVSPSDPQLPPMVSLPPVVALPPKNLLPPQESSPKELYSLEDDEKNEIDHKETYTENGENIPQSNKDQNINNNNNNNITQNFDDNKHVEHHPKQEHANYSRDRSGTATEKIENRRDESSTRKCSEIISSMPRFHLLKLLFDVIITKFLIIADIIIGLIISNNLWQKHEFLFAGAIAIIISPIIIAWTSALIFVEQILLEEKFGKGWRTNIFYPILGFYLILPLGTIIMIICEIFFFIIDIFEHFGRFILALPKEKDLLQSTGRTSYLRFRRLTHILSQSIPQLMFFILIYYLFSKDFKKDNIKYLYLGMIISLSNIIYTLFMSYNYAKSNHITLHEYLVLSLRLFGGFIPQLSQITNGDIKHVNWINFCFGNYSYAKFAAAVESPLCKLKKMVISPASLLQLSRSLCLQLGAACLLSKVQIEVWNGDSPRNVWKLLFKNVNEKTQTRMKFQQLKNLLKKLPMIQHKNEKHFTKVFSDLEYIYGTNGDRMYYYTDFVRDWRDGYYAPLFIITVPSIVAQEEKQRNLRVLNLLLGAGKVNEVDDDKGTSALYYAISKLDHDLIHKLCDRGAKTSSEDWKKLGELVIFETKQGNYDKLSSIVNLSIRRNEIELDLDYRDETGRSALHWAAYYGKQDIAQLLISCSLGCDVTGVDNEGLNAADLAKKNGHIQVENFLREQS